jgi:chromosome partitioning protein
MFDRTASLPKEVKADIEQFLNNARGTNCAWAQAQILPVYVRRNIKLAEAPSYGKTIFEYEQSCHGAEDYNRVAEFIHTQLQPAAEPNTFPAPADENANQAGVEFGPAPQVEQATGLQEQPESQ